MNYYQEEIETICRDELLKWQNKLFCKQVKNVYKNVPYYKKKIDSMQIDISDIKGIEDSCKLPYMTKDDLQQAYPDGLLAVPKSDCVRIQSTSGTTGKRIIAYYTKKDIEIWEECCARAIVAAGGTKDDVCQVSYGYGLFTGGAGLNGGAQKVGCLTLPMSVGNTQRQLQFMIDLNTSILCCTPSYAANLGESILKKGLKNKINLRAGIFGAEPWTNEMRNHIEEMLSIDAYDIYGLTEMMGPGVAFECTEKNGMHIQEDHFYAEIINPNSGEVLQEGEIGELVLTSLSKQAFPLIRYRTGDLCKIITGKCTCGRTHIRMSKPLGRCDDMIIVKGVNVWPTQIESVLLDMGYSSNYLIVVDREDNRDALYIDVETELDLKDEDKIKHEREKIENGIKGMLGIKVNVNLVEWETIQRNEGKAKRVIDKRRLY